MLGLRLIAHSKGKMWYHTHVDLSHGRQVNDVPRPARYYSPIYGIQQRIEFAQGMNASTAFDAAAVDYKPSSSSF